MMRGIIVGLDDSAASRAAHRWAAEYAYAVGKDLCVVHVMDWPVGLNPSAAKPRTRLRVPKHVHSTGPRGPATRGRPIGNSSPTNPARPSAAVLPAAR
jgi:nucleotide-binding universal stress UspA family protein